MGINTKVHRINMSKRKADAQIGWESSIKEETMGTRQLFKDTINITAVRSRKTSTIMMSFVLGFNTVNNQLLVKASSSHKQ